MWVPCRGVASPQPLDTRALFHNQQSPRPACLAGRDSADSLEFESSKLGQAFLLSNTSRLFALKGESQVAKMARR